MRAVLLLIALLAVGAVAEDKSISQTVTDFVGDGIASLASAYNRMVKFYKHGGSIKTFDGRHGKSNQKMLTEARADAATDSFLAYYYWDHIVRSKCEGKGCEAVDSALHRIVNPNKEPSVEGTEKRSSESSQQSFLKRLEEEEEDAIKEFHVIVRAFIPGAGTSAGAGHDDGMTLGKRGTFPGYKLPRDNSKSYAGYAVGIYELDEIFDTNHRDFSNSHRENAHSKTFVHLTFKRDSATSKWKVPSKASKTLANGSSRTHHYCDGNLAQYIGGWPTGLCCNTKAKWEPNEGFQMGLINMPSHLSFRVKVRKGNPCVPGSYYAGPILHNVGFTVDFVNRKISYTGKKSQFPAFEICWGTNKNSLFCHYYGVEGRDFLDLMFGANTIEDEGAF